ncbi:MAG: hypothetical protein ACI8XB_000327 [Patiriisocius sp.]|jgi:hypothetical protein
MIKKNYFEKLEFSKGYMQASLDSVTSQMQQPHEPEESCSEASFQRHF